jgi:hypothetical protein
MGGLVSFLAGHLLERIRLKAYAFALFAGAAASLLFAFAFALVALNHWIAVTYNSQYPELWIALGFVVIALIVLAVGLFLQNRKPEGNPAATMALLAAPPAFRLAARRLSPRTVAVGVVLIAGLALGRRFASRT